MRSSGHVRGGRRELDAIEDAWRAGSLLIYIRTDVGMIRYADSDDQEKLAAWFKEGLDAGIYQVCGVVDHGLPAKFL